MSQEQINEKLSASAPAKEWIDDFVKSDDPKFDGKSKDERIMMALGAYYAAKKEAKNESVEELEEATMTSGEKKIARDVHDALKDGEEMSQSHGMQIRSSHKRLIDKFGKQWRKVAGITEEISEEIASYSHSYVLKKIKDGEWEASSDVKPGKHVQMTNTSTKKKWTILVKEGSVSLNGDREGSVPVTEVKSTDCGTDDLETAIDDQEAKKKKEKAEGEGKCKIAEETIELAEKIYYGDYECGSEKSQFGGYRPHIVNKETGKTFYLGQASYKTPGEAKKHAESYLDQYSRGISHPNVPVKGTYVKETLDPVGKEDDDIDNDGDEDESDEYLKNRRKTVTKAVQKEEVEDLDEATMNSFPDFRSNLLSIYPSHSEEQVRAAWQKYKAEFLKKEEVELEEGVEEIKARVAKYKVGDKTNFGVIKAISDTSIEFKSKDLPVTKIAFNQRKMGSKDFVLDRLSRMNEMTVAEARELKVAQLALKSDGSGKLEDFVKNYSVVGKSIIQIKEEYAKFLASQLEEDQHTDMVRQANKDDRQKRAAAMAKVFSNLDVAKKKSSSKKDADEGIQNYP